ncbi:sugar phosphate isomerase/epimerase family protein [Cyclobacterium sp. SYSU L10401]|uniref:sugar phosphate isomerase/epimerase family protein n=1 Tax=Cyclobacterium sp. SYSU L10401 TaxID=2678657 RepID=UPI0013D3B559|nr:sugar phosphate isomerase/epimerase [Cyclobacterium sp. SYSU L10401]
MKTDRRKLLKSIGLGSVVAFSPATSFARTKKKTNFSYCLNTSTIRGQKTGLKRYIEIAAEAGYDGIEVWIEDVKQFIAGGNKADDLNGMIQQHGLRVENAIGFAPWMVADEEKSRAGFQQMEEEMELLAAIGCKRVAAPGIGAEAPVDLMLAGKRYKALLELGKRTGVMPQLEFWGAFAPFHHLGQVLMVAAVANDPDTRILPDVYHLYRGGSGFEGLKLINGNAIEIFHMNDYPGDIPREKQQDKDRVYPGDGIAPLKQIITDLKEMGGDKVLSLELFNPGYWEKDPLEVAKTGLKKMKQAVSSAS